MTSIPRIAVLDTVTQWGAYHDSFLKEAYRLMHKLECHEKLMDWIDLVTDTSFMENLCDLYVFTERKRMTDHDVTKYKKILKASQLRVSQAHVYVLQGGSAPNLKWMNIFEGISLSLYTGENLVGHIDPHIKFDTITYDYIMRNDSFKLNILSRYESSDAFPIIEAVRSRILKEKFNDTPSIQKFYENKKSMECAIYVQGIQLYYDLKMAFQCKMLVIRNSLKMNRLATQSIQTFDIFAEKLPVNYKEPPLECELLQNADPCPTLASFIQISYVSFHMLKLNRQRYMFGKNTINPFKLLNSRAIRTTIMNSAEFIKLGEEVYPNANPAKGRHEMSDVYVLREGTISIEEVLKHNNGVVSKLFQNQLPGNAILWHMVLLYILAVDKFPDQKDRLFEEIRVLGEHGHYFITLSPHVNLPIVEKLNACFWYLAHVCHQTFPNSKKNVIRSWNNAAAFLEFYRDVYEPEYTCPPEMPLWQLWKALNDRPKQFIYQILSYYLEYKVLPDTLKGAVQMVFLDRPTSAEPGKPLDFLSKLDLKTVLSVLDHYRNKSNSYYDELRLTQTESKIAKSPSLVQDVNIFLKTYYPELPSREGSRTLIYCFLVFFTKYCLKYKDYPFNGNKFYYYLHNNIFGNVKIPKYFSLPEAKI